MQIFKMKTELHKVDSFAQFAEEFGLNEMDLVITNDFLYKPFMQACNLKCNFIMQEQYGVGEPSDEMMNKILADVAGKKFNRVIGIGGGTVIDISKLFVIKDLTDVVPAFKREMPIIKDKQLIIIPTTAGTGSEVTNISIAELKSLHTKMGLADDAITPDVAVFIPELLNGLPFKPYAAASIDALIHAVEGYVSPKANIYTQTFSLRAIESIIDIFKNIAEKGEEYRHQRHGDMLIAANMAGIAFGNAGVGAVHAMSYPLGGTYHVPHGESNYQLFTEVFKTYHKKDPNGQSLQEIETFLAKQLSCSVENVYDELDALLSKLIPLKKLREYGMKDEEVRGFAENAMATQQRLLKNNYTPFTVEDMEMIYRKLY